MCTGAPSMRIVPVSACSAPARILMRVDLPAPFSPTRAWTDPGGIVSCASRIARTPPYRLDIPLISSLGRIIATLLRRFRTSTRAPHRDGAAHACGPSVGELSRVVLRDDERRAEQQHLRIGVVARLRSGLHVGFGRDLLALGEL